MQSTPRSPTVPRVDTSPALVEPRLEGAGQLDPIDALQLLRRLGFHGRRLHDAHGNTTALHYQRTWRGVVDIVMVYAEDDAEAYRIDDSLSVDVHPLDLVCCPDLLIEAVGTVLEVVATVSTWSTASSRPDLDD
jgi:hypothetical protein